MLAVLFSTQAYGAFIELEITPNDRQPYFDHYVQASDVNNAGDVTGRAGDSGFIWNNGEYELFTYPGGKVSPYFFTDTGIICQVFADTTGFYLYSGGTFTPASPPPPYQGALPYVPDFLSTGYQLLAANNNGITLGLRNDETPFIYDASADQFSILAPPFETNRFIIRNLNDNGQYVGTYLIDDGWHGFVTDLDSLDAYHPAPLPAAAWLLAPCLAGLWCMRRRRR